MFHIYRFGLGKWALLSVLFAAGAMMGITRFHDNHDNIDPTTLPPLAAGRLLQQSVVAFPCERMIYSISQDGVRYVREGGGGSVYAARLNRKVSFYQLNPYGYMIPADGAAVDAETAGNLRNALLQCLGPWLPSGAWFTLSAQTEAGGSALN
jgi:hypothetical protein